MQGERSSKALNVLHILLTSMLFVFYPNRQISFLLSFEITEDHVDASIWLRWRFQISPLITGNVVIIFYMLFFIVVTVFVIVFFSTIFTIFLWNITVDQGIIKWKKVFLGQICHSFVIESVRKTDALQWSMQIKLLWGSQAPYSKDYKVHTQINNKKTLPSQFSFFAISTHFTNPASVLGPGGDSSRERVFRRSKMFCTRRSSSCFLWS